MTGRHFLAQMARAQLGPAGPRRRCRRRCSHPSPRCLLARRCHSQQTRQGRTWRRTARRRRTAQREPSGGIRHHHACLPVPEDRLAPKGLQVRAAPRVPADQLDPSGPFDPQTRPDRTVLVVRPAPVDQEDRLLPVPLAALAVPEALDGLLLPAAPEVQVGLPDPRGREDLGALQDLRHRSLIRLLHRGPPAFLADLAVLAGHRSRSLPGGSRSELSRRRCK